MTDSAYGFAEHIRQKLNDFTPRFALILGSGLGALANEIENPRLIGYYEIPGFPRSTVAGHNGRFVAGLLCGQKVLCMQGRIHLYEGYAPALVASVIKSFKLLGIEGIIVTNAAGSLNPAMQPGSLMLINDHINLSGFNPLIGPNDDRFGPRFPNMSRVYTPEWRQQAHRAAAAQNIPLFDGTYCMLSGPNFETAAEIRACRILGADANGMSTVPETMVAAYCGMKVLGISAITNYCTGIEGGSPSHNETLETANRCTAGLTALVKTFLEKYDG